MLCLACGTLRAQRCLPGTWSVELSAGAVDGLLLRDEHSAHSFFGRLTWSRYRRNLNRWTFGMTYLRKDYPYKHVNVPMAQFTAEAGYFTPLLWIAGVVSSFRPECRSRRDTKRQDAGKNFFSTGRPFAIGTASFSAPCSRPNSKGLSATGCRFA